MKNKILILALFGLFFGKEVYGQGGSLTDGWCMPFYNVICDGGTVCFIRQGNSGTPCCKTIPSGPAVSVCFPGPDFDPCSILNEDWLNGAAWVFTITSGCSGTAIQDTWDVNYDPTLNGGSGGFVSSLDPNYVNSTFSDLKIPDIAILIDSYGLPYVVSPGCQCTNGGPYPDYY